MTIVYKVVLAHAACYKYTFRLNANEIQSFINIYNDRQVMGFKEVIKWIKKIQWSLEVTIWMGYVEFRGAINKMVRDH
jgi:hypothetical protein